MKNVIAVMMLGMLLASCAMPEISMPGVKKEGKFSPPSDWIMTAEAEARITPAADGSRWTEYTWSEWGDKFNRESRHMIAALMPDNSIAMIDYMKDQNKEDAYRHEVYHAELTALGVPEQANHNHGAPYWVLTKSWSQREPAFINGGDNKRIANPAFGR